MGKKKRHLYKRGIIIGLVCCSLILVFQNCSDINIQQLKLNSVSNTPGVKKGEWDLCPKNNIIITDNFYPVSSGATRLIQDKFGKSNIIDQGTTLVIKFKVPENHGLGGSDMYFGSYYTASTKTFALSKTACDFSPENAVKDGSGRPIAGFTETGSIRHDLFYSLPGSEVGLIVGETYYLNIYQLTNTECYEYEKNANNVPIIYVYASCRPCDPHAGGREVPDGCALAPVDFM